MKRKTPHNANSSSTEDTEGGEPAKAPLRKTSQNKVQFTQKAGGMPQHGHAGHSNDSGAETWSSVGRFATTNLVLQQNVIRPKDGAKQSSNSAYEQATTGHNTAFWEK